MWVWLADGREIVMEEAGVQHVSLGSEYESSWTNMIHSVQY